MISNPDQKTKLTSGQIPIHEILKLKRTYDFESGSENKTNFRPDPDPRNTKTKKGLMISNPDQKTKLTSGQIPIHEILKLLFRIRNTGFWNFLR
jgi:hypothetical protein